MDTPEEIALRQELVQLQQEVAAARLSINTDLNRYTAHICEQYDFIRDLGSYVRGLVKVVPAELAARKNHENY